MTIIKTDDFFFSWRTHHGLPYVVNFYLRCRARNFSSARAAARFMVDYFKLRGVKKFILNSLERRAYLRALIQFQFKTQPYATLDGHHYYLVEVK